MMTWVNSIMDGMKIFGSFAFPAFLPVIMIAMIMNRRVNIVELIVKELFVLYMCCVFALVFLPLPSFEAAADLTYKWQIIPMYSFVRIANDFSAFQVLQVVFNIVMTIPFGMFLRYCFKFSKKEVLICSVALTILIEVGQLTGLFFIFKGSYRLFDVDDLICNTLGGMIGFYMMVKAEAFVPAVELFDRVLRGGKKPVQIF